MKVTAIVPAAGRGMRMREDISKQYLPLAGKPILAHTLLAIEHCPAIDEIILAVRESDIAYCQEEVVKKFTLKKVKEIIAGGERRQDSVYQALKRMGPNCDLVLIHDSVRPFITEEIILRTIKETKLHGAVATAVPLTDTIKQGDGGGFVKKTLSRDELWSIQTPQGFKYSLIQKACSQAHEDGFYGTDDAGLVERIGHPVKMIEGSPENIKITTPEDLIIAEAILRERERRIDTKSQRAQREKV
ncbi:2-C-methyl-D-erythritol 4-phosphate cytidylyltransferase [candidate division NPL-UPA2 bacterium]|nr:2-C-methyl-D-erythritol 4-phosphate cytidylyltransferase [candidate division NPL-UPA2 bacterium]